MLEAPANPVYLLDGDPGSNDPNEETASRSADSLVLVWPTIAVAESYDLRIGRNVVGNVQQPYSFSGLSPRSAHEMAYRYAIGPDTSEWSPVRILNTRPQSPAAPVYVGAQTQPHDPLEDLPSRRADGFVAEWSDPAAVGRYEVTLNQQQPFEVTQARHDFVSLLANHVYRVKVRTNEYGNRSIWSTAQEFRTRPPVARGLSRSFFNKTTSTGPVIRWSVDTNFPDAVSLEFAVRRRDAATSQPFVEIVRLPADARTFTDFGNDFSIVFEYEVIVVVAGNAAEPSSPIRITGKGRSVAEAVAINQTVPGVRTKSHSRIPVGNPKIKI